MDHRRPNCNQPATKSHTLPSSPTHSSSSSDFEFTISSSHRKSSAAAADLCPADELFYKGQLLPLHLSPRLSMVRTLLLSSASTSSDTTTTTSTTASRDSTASRSSADFSGRPSSAADEPEFKRLTNKHWTNPGPKPVSKYFSLPKLFRTEQRPPPPSAAANPAKRVGSSAKEMMRRYLKKVKPFYDKLAQKQKAPTPPPPKPPPWRIFRSARNTLCMVSGHKDQELSNCPDKENRRASILNSFSGNLRLYSGDGARSYISSCPSSMGSSPNHGKSGFGLSQTDRAYNSYASSMEELQNAIQGAIAHCKNSMLQNQTVYGQ
ncbi:hypothetical protein OROHE_003150 [Orobanche hederae]